MFSFPPTNHFANGAFHSRTFFQRFCQTSSLASRAQNFSGRLIDSRYIRRYCSKASNAGVLRKCLRRFENAFLDKVRLDVFGHGNQEASNLAAALNGKAVAASLCEAREQISASCDRATAPPTPPSPASAWQARRRLQVNLICLRGAARRTMAA